MMLIETNKNTVKCSISEFPFTSIGSEIATLTKSATSDEDFIFFAKEVAKDPSIVVSVHKINYVNENSINYDTKNLLNK